MLPTMTVLETMLYGAKNYDRSLNFEKVRVQKQQVGLMISAEALKPDPEKVRAMKDMPSPKTKGRVSILEFIQYLDNSSQSWQ